MKRRFFNAGAVVSLVLCLMLTALWLRSFWRYDDWELQTRPVNLDIASYKGVLWINCITPGTAVAPADLAPPPLEGFEAEFLRFSWHSLNLGRQRWRQLGLPHRVG